ncbi:MAG: SDR family NAD(P)-dependent oxidoreductase, partial [Deltaproteobacteria bacterium]|nr:SDR family NAD(P)-dependent oxidoreductase [Deltaproteobacteria bacterium]
MKYLVTGGAGFIGSHIVERLVKEGERVRVLDNLDAGKMENLAPLGDRVEFIKGDIRSWDVVKKAVSGIEYIFHEAALRSVPKSMTEPVLYHEVNVTGTLNLLEIARQGKAKKFVFASSSSLYGNSETFPQREDLASQAISPYALGKRTGEEYCAFYSSVFGLPTVCLRYFNVFGPRQTMDNEYAVVIPKF